METAENRNQDLFSSIPKRVFRFRAWNNEKMDYGIDMKSASVLIEDYPEISLMQSTGMIDIFGMEIYEGDIVLPVKFKDVPNVVHFLSNGFYRVKRHGVKEYYNPLGNCQIKVIGNIFQNSELLK
jgi:hypothetical protein